VPGLDGARHPIWRALVPVTVAAAGLLLVTSAVTARGTDLRASHTMGPAELIQREQGTVAALTREASDLRAGLSAATAVAARSNAAVRAARAREARLAPLAGLTTAAGPALRVALDDAPRRVQQRDLAAGAAPNDLVIHQQDVQAVVNALWAGGAQAMTIMGQRVVATTAVRCVGNTLLLHGRVYSPPFRVTAIGTPDRLRRALDSDRAVQIFQQYVAAYGLGFHVSSAPHLSVPPYRGALELTYAQATT
jgi:uncharacterized protein YlxW (UPF0749 family)